jgi:hypothetical protein
MPANGRWDLIRRLKVNTKGGQSVECVNLKQVYINRIQQNATDAGIYLL